MTVDIEIIPAEKHVEFEEICIGSFFKAVGRIGNTGSVRICVKTSAESFFDLSCSHLHNDIESYRANHSLFKFGLIPKGTLIKLRVVD